MIARAFRRNAAEHWDIARRARPLVLVAFLVDAAFIFVFLVALQSYLPESRHASSSIAGFALAAFGLAKLVTQVGGGLVSDRLSPGRAIRAGAGLLLIAYASMLAVSQSTPWLIVGAATLAGLGSSVIWPALYADGYARFAENEESRFSALLTLSTGGALLAGLGSGGLLDPLVSFRTAMLAPIAATVIALAVTFSMKMASGEFTIQRTAVVRPPTDLRTLFRRPQHAAFGALILAEAAALGVLTAAFRAYGREVLSASLTRQELLLMPAAVLGAASVVPGGMLADRVGGKSVMALGFGAAAACLFVLARAQSPAAVVPAAALGGAGFGLAVPAIAATMMELAGRTALPGGVIGWFMMMDGVGHTAGPAIAGALLASSGAGAALVTAAALFLLAAGIAACTPLLERGVARAVPLRARPLTRAEL